MVFTYVTILYLLFVSNFHDYLIHTETGTNVVE